MSDGWLDETSDTAVVGVPPFPAWVVVVAPFFSLVVVVVASVVEVLAPFAHLDPDPWPFVHVVVAAPVLAAPDDVGVPPVAPAVVAGLAVPDLDVAFDLE